MEKPIPTDCLFDILRLLPTRSLRRFETVSKSCRFIINYRLFKTHHRSQAVETDSCFGLISLLGHNTFGFSDIESPSQIKISFNCGKAEAARPMKVRSCNGLLCFTILNKYVVIANLLSKNVDDFYMTSIPSGNWNVSGFGFDTVNDDYKLVMIQQLSEHRETNIYSIKSNTWSDRKHVGSVSKGITFRNMNGVAASGALHWLGSRQRRSDLTVVTVYMIIAFDLTTEEFYEISFPRWIKEREILVTRLGTLKGSLCVLIGTGSRHQIWVMKEYGVAGFSWTKLFSVSYDETLSSTLTPLIWSEDKVLLFAEAKRCFYWYDLREKKLVTECVSNSSKVLSLESICVNSIVSVSDYKGGWMKWRKRYDEEEELEALEYFFAFRDEFNHYKHRLFT